MANKMTKASVLSAIRAQVENMDTPFIEGMTNTELLMWIDHEVDLLTAKRAGSGKPSKSQIKGDEDSEVILEVMRAADKPMTVGEICEECNGRFSGAVSSQRVTALLTKMKGIRVRQWKEKKVSLYAVIEGNVEDTSDEEVTEG